MARVARQPGPYDLDLEDLKVLEELAPDLVAAALATGFPGTVSRQRALLESVWHHVTGRRKCPQARTGALPESMASRSREGVPNWWLARGQGILQGRAAPVFAVYAHRLREGEGRAPPVELTALAARLLVSGQVQVLTDET